MKYKIEIQGKTKYECTYDTETNVVDVTSSAKSETMVDIQTRLAVMNNVMGYCKLADIKSIEIKSL